MSSQIVIDNARIAEQIQRIAEQEHRSVEDVLLSMVALYRLSPAADPGDAEAMARSVRQAAYNQARAYWNRVGRTELAAMTDEQLDESFWLFDEDDVPRLKEDMPDVELPESSLNSAGQILRSAGFRSGQSDISIRSRQILADEYTDYLLSRMNSSSDDDASSA